AQWGTRHHDLRPARLGGDSLRPRARRRGRLVRAWVDRFRNDAHDRSRPCGAHGMAPISRRTSPVDGGSAIAAARGTRERAAAIRLAPAGVIRAQPADFIRHEGPPPYDTKARL